MNSKWGFRGVLSGSICLQFLWIALNLIFAFDIFAPEIKAKTQNSKILNIAQCCKLPDYVSLKKFSQKYAIFSILIFQYRMFGKYCPTRRKRAIISCLINTLCILILRNKSKLSFVFFQIQFRILILICWVGRVSIF